MVGGLVAVGKRLVCDEDDFGALGFGLGADFFLFRGDEGRDEDGASRGFIEPAGCFYGYGLGRVIAADFTASLSGLRSRNRLP